VTAGIAATGSAEAVEAWNRTLASQPSAVDVATARQQLGLANPQPGDGTDLWATCSRNPGRPGHPLRAAPGQVLHEMALADAPPRPRDPAAPDVSALRVALGL
jgi:hypothetical protein